jgi:ABC-type transport system involved in cytochrome bd biosynthesis fused ATPase/permease subunit
MGLTFGIAVAIVTLLVAGVILFASGMSDSQAAVSDMRPKIFATLCIGTAISAALVFGHFHQIGW